MHSTNALRPILCLCIESHRELPLMWQLQDAKIFLLVYVGFQISVHNVAEQSIEEALPSWNMYIQASGYFSFVLGK